MTARYRAESAESAFSSPRRSWRRRAGLPRGTPVVAGTLAIGIVLSTLLVAPHSVLPAASARAPSVGPIGTGPASVSRPAVPELRPLGPSGILPGSSLGLPTPTSSGRDAFLATANLLNQTYGPGVHPAPQGLTPDGVAVDTATGDVFVANFDTGSVSVFSPTDRLIASVVVGHGPTAAAYDPAGNEVFVSNSGSNNVSVINATSFHVVTSLAVGAQSGYFASAPTDVVYASDSGDVFVMEPGRYILPCCTYNVTEIDGATNAVVRVLHLGAGPTSASYDPTTDQLFVMDWDSWDVSIVDATTGTTQGTVYLPQIPYDIGIDPASGVLAVVDWYGGPTNLTEYSISGGTATFRQTLTIPDNVPNWGTMTFDPAAGAFLVVQYGRGLVGIDASNGTIRTFATDGTCLSSLGYFSNGQLLATDACENALVPVNATTGIPGVPILTGAAPGALLADPTSHRLLAADGSGRSVDLLDSTTLAPTGSVPVGVAPVAMTYDTASRTTYVLSNGGQSYAYGQQSVSALPDSSTQVSASIPLPGGYASTWDGIGYGASTDRVYVVGVTSAQYGDSNENLTVIDPASGQIVGNETVTIFSGGSLSGNYYAQASVLALPGNLLVVSDPWEGRVFGMNAVNGTRLWTAVVGGTPTLLLQNPLTGQIDVANAGTGKISVLSTTGAVEQTLTLQHPVSGLAYDTGNNRTYVAESSGGSGLLEVIDSATGAITDLPIPTPLAGVAYLSDSGLVAVAGAGSSAIYYVGAGLAAQPLNATVSPAIQGEGTTFTTGAAFGYPPYSYNWTHLPAGCRSSSTPQLNCTPGQVGSSSVSVTVSDLANESATESMTLTVGPYPLNVTIGVSPATTSPTNGSRSNCSVQLAPGEAAVLGTNTTYTWAVRPVGGALLNNTTGSTVAITFDWLLNVTLTLSTDFNGTKNASSIVFDVVAAPPPPGGTLGSSANGGLLSGGLLYALIGTIVVVAVVAVVATVVMVRRRRGPPPQAPGHDENAPENGRFEIDMPR